MKLLYKQEKYRKHNLHKTETINRCLCKRKKKKHKAEGINHNAEKICFPDKLFLESKDEEIFYYIHEAENMNKPHLNFTNTKYIDVGSALYIKAFVDFLKNQGKDIKISCSPKNQKMQQILQHIVVFNYKLKITHKDINCWTIKEWDKKNVENYGKVMMEEILPKVLEDKVPSESFSKIAAGLQELLSNCSEHAYISMNQFTNFYLIAGEYENDLEKSNSFSFCIIDCGQGFRSSLRKSSFFDEMKEIFERESDSKLLKAAADGRFNAEKRKNSGRGTGLPAVAENVRLIKGSLYFYSDKGSYCIKAESDPELRERKYMTKGSIIEVVLPINDNEKQVL